MRTHSSNKSVRTYGPPNLKSAFFLALGLSFGSVNAVPLMGPLSSSEPEKTEALPQAVQTHTAQHQQSIELVQTAVHEAAPTVSYAVPVIQHGHLNYNTEVATPQPAKTIAHPISGTEITHVHALDQHMKVYTQTPPQQHQQVLVSHQPAPVYQQVAYPQAIAQPQGPHYVQQQYVQQPGQQTAQPQVIQYQQPHVVYQTSPQHMVLVQPQQPAQHQITQVKETTKEEANHTPKLKWLLEQAIKFAQPKAAPSTTAKPVKDQDPSEDKMEEELISTQLHTKVAKAIQHQKRIKHDNILRRRMNADKHRHKNKKDRKPAAELTEQSIFSEDLQRHSVLVASVLVSLIIAVNNGYTDLAGFCVSEQVLKQQVCQLFYQSIVQSLLFISLTWALQTQQFITTATGVAIGIYYSLFLFLWFVGSIFLLIKAQEKISVWRTLESNALNEEFLEEKRNQYERIYYAQKKQVNDQLNFGMPVSMQNTSGGDELASQMDWNAFPSSLIQVLRYFVMRVQFISPVFVPGTKEHQLRVDFNFAEYLARSYAVTLNQFWRLNFCTLLLSFGLLTAWAYTVQIQSSLDKQDQTHIDEVFMGITVALPIILFTTGWFSSRKLMKIETQLQQQVAGPECDVPLAPELLTVDGMKSESLNQPLPTYLNNPQSIQYHQQGGQNQDLNSSMYIREINQQQNNRRTGCADNNILNRIVSSGCCDDANCHSNHANPHERLFGCGRHSKYLWLLAVQLLFVLQMLSIAFCFFTMMSVYTSYSLGNMQNKEQIKQSVIQATLASVGLLIGLVSVVKFIPFALQILSVTTHIEMMKDANIIKEVVKDQKLAKAERGLRILAAFRYVRRDHVKAILSENIPTSQGQIQDMLEKKINDVTSERLREQSTRMTDSMMDESHIVNSMEDEDSLDQTQDNKRKPQNMDESLMFDNEKESINFDGVKTQTSAQALHIPGGKDQRGTQQSYSGEQSFYNRNSDQTMNSSFRGTEYSRGTDFSTAVDKYCDLSHSNAYQTSKSLLQLQFGKQSDLILYEDFKFFLLNSSQYFVSEDLELFLRDVEVGLRLEGDRVSINQISAMIEYDSECFPQ